MRKWILKLLFPNSLIDIYPANECLKAGIYEYVEEDSPKIKKEQDKILKNVKQLLK